MFRSISRVFFVLICASGATVAMAVNEKNDKDTIIGTTCPVRRPNGVVNTTYADNCESYASKVCYGNNGDGFANICVVGCQTCRTGYNLTTASGTADEAASSDLFLTQCTFEYKTCKEIQCNKTCLGFQQWKLASERENYESSYIRRLNTIKCTCDTIYSYRCTNGYYNALSNTDAVVRDKKNLRCVKCPQVPDKGALSYGTAKAGYNAGISSCYTDKGDSYSHKVQEGIKTKTIGKYRLSADCYYK